MRYNRVLMSVTVPQTVYKTPEPEAFISECYTIFAQVLPGATDPNRRWVIKEAHGYWDEAELDPTAKFKLRVNTLEPTDPQHCVTLDEAQKLVDEQVRFRAKSGFKFLFMRDFFEPRGGKRYEILPDGSTREIPFPF